MEKKYLFLPVFMAFLVVIILIFSGCLSSGGYSIQYHEKYDNDNFPESNPVIQHPIRYAYQNHGNKTTPVVIAVLLKNGTNPAPDENVTLMIWNTDSVQYYHHKTNKIGFASFIVGINASQRNEIVYHYRVYRNDDETIATDIRQISINDTTNLVRNDGKQIELVKKEWILSGEIPILRIAYSVVSERDLNDTFHFKVKDYSGQLLHEESGFVTLVKDKKKNFTFDIRLKYRNRSQMFDVNFSFEDYIESVATFWAPAMNQPAAGQFVQPVGGSLPPIAQPQPLPWVGKPIGVSVPPPPPPPDPPKWRTPDEQDINWQDYDQNSEDSDDYYYDLYSDDSDYDYFDNYDFPSDIPEGDNFIVVGILTMMLVAHVVIQRRER